MPAKGACHAGQARLREIMGRLASRRVAPRHRGVVKILSPGPLSGGNKCCGTFDQPLADGHYSRAPSSHRSLHLQRATREVVSDTVSKTAKRAATLSPDVFIRGGRTLGGERGRVSVVTSLADAPKGVKWRIFR